KILDKLIRIALTPLMKFLLMWLVLSVLLLLVSVIFIKLLYPEWPLGKIITRKLIFTTVFGSLCILLTDLLLKMIWNAYTEYRYIWIFVAGIAMICFAVYPYIKNKAEEPLIIYNDIE
ncbi:MAG: hypothetical protein IKF68_00900, partial [Erysipelotrichaceae bacterium]|nr:hypothetical protein [Erysipelotrichaceae bacterium]